MSRGPGLLAQARGLRGEDLAHRYLTGIGYLIIERNFKTRAGEIDLVARDRQTTVFVEVKRRESSEHGTAAEFVNPSKIRKVVSAARIYAAKNRLEQTPMRFDVVAIDVVDGREEIHHHKGAFDAR